jgi:hypothetical protein
MAVRLTITSRSSNGRTHHGRHSPNPRQRLHLTPLLPPPLYRQLNAPGFATQTFSHHRYIHDATNQDATQTLSPYAAVASESFERNYESILGKMRVWRLCTTHNEATESWSRSPPPMDGIPPWMESKVCVCVCVCVSGVGVGVGLIVTLRYTECHVVSAYQILTLTCWLLRTLVSARAVQVTMGEHLPEPSRPGQPVPINTLLVDPRLHAWLVASAKPICICEQVCVRACVCVCVCVCVWRCAVVVQLVEWNTHVHPQPHTHTRAPIPHYHHHRRHYYSCLPRLLLQSSSRPLTRWSDFSASWSSQRQHPTAPTFTVVAVISVSLKILYRRFLASQGVSSSQRARARTRLLSAPPARCV